MLKYYLFYIEIDEALAKCHGRVSALSRLEVHEARWIVCRVIGDTQRNEH